MRPTQATVYGSDATKGPRMAVERTPTGSNLIEVLDRVLDKGIVIDAWVRALSWASIS
jgi:gas vesicle protein GvpA/GvpJ/GvpM family